MILLSKLKNTNQDYEKFLVQLYQKRMKANHTKFSEYLHNIYYLDDILSRKCFTNLSTISLLMKS